MIDHLADLESDFSAIHRVDDIYAMDGPRFFRLAWRISTYEGVMRMRLEQQERQEPTAVHRPAATSTSSAHPLAAVLAEQPDLIERVVLG